jgi:large subunit ribosomal protein L15
MQLNNLKFKNKKKARKVIGRGGKKGTYCGKGCKGQKARSGAHVNPLFEGGRSTLIDHMKKVRGFKSSQIGMEVKLSQLEKYFQDGETVSAKSLLEKKLVKKVTKKSKIKILGDKDKISKKLIIDKEIPLSASAKIAIEKAGGSIK